MTYQIHTQGNARWQPVAVRHLVALLAKTVKRGHGFANVYALRKNIAYNLQYLEFLIKVLEQIQLTSVLEKQTIKMFVIVGCGIMESLLEYLLIKSNHHKKTEWERDAVMPGQEKEYNGRRIRIDSQVYVKLPSPRLLSMDFDAMIKASKSKRVLGQGNHVYAKLDALRRLRNRVHLNVISNPTDTDWNAFDTTDLRDMASVIHATFTGSIFHPSQRECAYFSYLQQYLTQ